MRKLFLIITILGLTHNAKASLITYFPLDPSSTLVQIDQSGNGNDASPIGLPVYSSQIPPVIFPDSGSLFFDGGSNALLVSSATTSSVIQSTFAVSFWFMASNLSTPNQALMSSRQPDVNGFCVFVSSNSMRLILGDGKNPNLNSLVNMAYNFNANQWYQVFIQASSLGQSTYVNGNLIGSSAFSGNPILKDSNHWFYIGNKLSGQGTPFTGFIDEIKIFNELVDPHMIVTLAQTVGTNIIPAQTTYILTQDQLNDIKQQIYVNVFKHIIDLPDSFFTGVSTDPIINASPVYPLMIPVAMSTGSYCYTVSTGSYSSWNDIFKLNVINGLVSKSFDDVTWPVTFFPSLQDVEDQ